MREGGERTSGGASVDSVASMDSVHARHAGHVEGPPLAAGGPEAERRRAVMRLLIVVLACLVFAWKWLSPSARDSNWPSTVLPAWALVAILAFALVQATTLMILTPRRTLTKAGMRLVRLSDSVLVFSWIAVSGGIDSPWTIALYVMIASRALRYSAKATLFTAVSFALAFLAVTAALGQVPGHVEELIVRIAFMIVIAWGAAVSARERGRLLASRVRLLDLTQEVGQVGTWEWSTRENVLVWSEELYRIFGIARDVQPTFDRYMAAIHPEDREEVGAAVASALAARSSTRFEHRIVRPDGAVRWLHCRGRVLLDRDGQPLEMVGSAQDITERRRMQEQLRAADKLASIGTMASGIAHEINNPLAYLGNNLTIIERRLSSGERPDDGELREAVAAVRHASERVKDIVRGLKTFSRSEDHERAVVDLSVVADLAITIVAHEIAKHARLVRVYEPVSPVTASESRLSQVVVNLLVNAVQSIEQSGKTDNELRIRIFQGDDGRVRLSVSDTGTGMSSDVMGRIFDPFFTTKPTGVGTGLGLSICHGIVRDHGGDITVESILGQGATFYVTLPAAATAEVKVDGTTSESTSDEPCSHRARILVVDDEPRYGRSLSLLLGQDHDVALARSGKEALGVLGSGASFDVVLCDLMMPEMTGMELYEQLDAEQRSRVVFLTGGATTDTARAFLARPEVRFMEKPVDPAELESLIARRSSPRLAVRHLVDAER